MRHTPGQWKTGSTRTQVVVWPEGWNVPMCIADCHTKNAPEYKPERVANARLIAAAPELFATAMQLHLSVNGMHCTMRVTNQGYRNSPLCAALDALILANANAIAKATA